MAPNPDPNAGFGSARYVLPLPNLYDAGNDEHNQHSQGSFNQMGAVLLRPIPAKPGVGGLGMWTRGQVTDVSILQRARRR